MPPDQKASQMVVIWFLISPVSLGGVPVIVEQPDPFGRVTGEWRRRAGGADGHWRAESSSPFLRRAKCVPDGHGARRRLVIPCRVIGALGHVRGGSLPADPSARVERTYAEGMSDGREEREDEKTRREQEQREGRVNRYEREYRDEGEPERADS